MVASQMYFSMAVPSFQAPLRAAHCDFLEVFEDDLDTSNLHARFVSPVVRQRLLAERQPWAPSHVKLSADAETLLADLGRLAPSVAKDFVTKHSISASLPFRLINDIAFDGEEESYIAMSYAWNKANQDTPRKMVSPVGDLPFGWVRTVEQFPLPTSRGMFQAVLDERRPGEGLWFDQVCIIQEDKNEKAVAIGAMDIIYKNARTVVVALDDITATGDELFFLEQYIQQHAFAGSQPNYQPNRALNPPFMQQQPLFSSFVTRVLSSIWFERAWCAHEMKMGRSHVFLVPCIPDDEDEGVYTVIRFTGTFFLHLLVLANEDTTILPPQRTQIRSLLEHFGRKSLIAERDALAAHSPNDTKYTSLSEPASLIPTVAEIFRMKAGGNPRLPEYLKRLDANRDKASIALNIAGLPLALRAASPLQRPTIEEECLRQLLVVGVAARDPVALCTTGAPLKLHDGSISWLCRPTTLDLPSIYQKSPPRFPETANPITQGSDGRAEFVQLDLVFLDLPHRNQPNTNFPAHVNRARELVELCIQYQIHSHMLWNTCLAPDHVRAPAMQNIFIQSLACALECGAEWFLDATSHFQPSTNTSLNIQTLSTLFNPQLLLQQFIHYPAAHTTLSSLLEALASLITYGIPWASGATERTHGPLIITAPPSSASSSPYPNHIPNPYSPHIPAPRKALIFAPFLHSKTLLVAVPDAVKGADYKGLARGWILTTRNPYTGSPQPMVSWELRGKSVVFGGGGFVADLGSAFDSRNHRVYGPGI
ncbi:hypothetical protein K458DRAFT_412794 [Lentithecium fluviatile CBS 122367]|uniref:Heterokaryon incompatibility domain-containing protein n=1 Tax=Lentithecium fluviatile CBS 122367 TaxID=1168545 RepID=A0A6G1JHM5_9PLEO|nr:hypothetical protein K458DRAFT_412794 [Lentithecium fluviatile CBS 122367]